jgi:nicotinate-nucleotide adenylyltransferase
VTYVTNDAAKPRVGLLGGTFDPPHLGHLVMAETVRDALDLDEVRFVVANVPWQKEGARPITDPERRLALVAASVDGVPGLTSSDIEVRLGGPSFTAVTLEALAEHEPATEWHLILGADAAAGLETWHRPADVRRRCRLAVVDRPGWLEGAPPAGWPHQRVEMPLIGISSTLIRSRIQAGRSIRFLCPAPVVDLIEQWQLYRRPA